MIGYWLLAAGTTVFPWETINVLTTAILQHITTTLATGVGSLLSSLWRFVIFLWGSKQKLQREVNDCKAHKITMFTLSHHTSYIHSITAWWKAPSNRSLTIGVIYTDLMGHLFFSVMLFRGPYTHTPVDVIKIRSDCADLFVAWQMVHGTMVRVDRCQVRLSRPHSLRFQQVLMVIPGAVANRTWQEVYLWGKVLFGLGCVVTD